MVVIPTTIFQYNKQSLLTYRVDPGEFFHYSTLDVQIPCQSRKSDVKKMLFNWIISLPMMVCLFWAVFFIVRIVLRNEEPRVQWSILLFYIISTTLYTNHWLYFSGQETTVGFYLYSLANLSVYPLYYIYLRALTRTRESNKEIYLLFIPTIATAVFFPLNMHYGWINGEGQRLCTRTFFAIQVIWVWVRGFQLIRSTQKRLDDTYTDYRSHLLHPTRQLLVFIGITAFVSMLLNLLGRDMFDGSLLVCIPAVVMSVLLFSLGYIAAHTILPQETVAMDEDEEDIKRKVLQATTAETDELFTKVTTALREQKLFTNPRLTIQDLATAVNSNRTYVSACINRRTKFTFAQLVAQYRVEHAKTILVDPKYTTDHEALTDASVFSGFSSGQNFYRVFKESTGITPLQYRLQNMHK